MIDNPIFTGIMEAVIWTVGVVIMLIVSYNFVPYIEQNYYPVINTKNFVLQYVSTAPKDLIIVNLSFEKKRACEPLLDRFSWYVANDSDHYERIYFEIPENKGDISRPIGLNISSGWKVNLKDYSGFTKKQKIIFYHKCNPFWVTRTEIKIPDVKNR